MLLSLLVAANCAITTRLYDSEIQSDGLTNWGAWGVPEFCPFNSYAVGFNLKIEPPQGTGRGEDDTALNGIKLICSDKTLIYSEQAQWGAWGRDMQCTEGNKLSSFTMKSEGPQGGDDDTAANAIKFYCSNRQLIQSNLEGNWGRWGDIISCPDNHYICGLRTQVESPQGGDDDTALNNVIFYCCT